MNEASMSNLTSPSLQRFGEVLTLHMSRRRERWRRYEKWDTRLKQRFHRIPPSRFESDTELFDSCYASSVRPFQLFRDTVKVESVPEMDIETRERDFPT